MADDSILKYSDLIADDGTFEDISKNIEQLKKELLDLAKVIKKDLKLVNPNDAPALEAIEKRTKEAAIAKKNLVKVEKELQKAKKKNIELTHEELVQREAEKIARRERVKAAKAEARVQKAQAGSVEELRARLAQVTLQWKSLSIEELKNGKVGKSLVAQKKALTDQLKKLEKQTGDTRRNVGNYTDSLGRLGKVAARVFVGRSIVDGLKRISTFFTQLIKDNKDANESLNQLDKGFGRFTSALTNAGTKLLTVLAPAILFVVDGLTDLLNFLSGGNDQLNQFSATSDELAGTIDNLNKEFVKETAELNQVFHALEQTNEGSEERKEIIDQINAQYGKYLPNLLTEKSTLEEVAAAQDLLNEALTRSFLQRIQQATQTDIFINKTNAQTEAFKQLQERAVKAGGEIDDKLTFAFSQLVETFRDTEGAGKDARNIIRGVTSSFGAAGDRLGELNPNLLELVRELKNLGSDTGNTIAFIEKIAKETGQYNDAIDQTNAAIGGLNEGMQEYNHEVTTNTTNLNANTAAQEKNAQARLKALEELRDQVAQAEAENKQDLEERALALEEQRFKEEVRLREANFDKLLQLTIEQGGDFQEVIDLNNKQVEQQLEQHEENKLKIRKDFAVKTIEIEALTQEQIIANNERAQKEINEAGGIDLNELKAKQKLVAAENQKALDDQRKQQEASSKELIDNIAQTAQKVGAIINDLFAKQADLAAKNVETQEGNLERARDRASRGLEANIVKEEQLLAQKQAEQQRREKEAQQAAKLVTLFNLVSAYASNGDENALARGLVDFSLLEAFGAGIQGFYDGTENVEDSLGSSSKFFEGKRDSYLGITGSGKMLRFDGKERILNPAQNMALGSMSNDMLVENALLGSQLSDNYNPHSIAQMSAFDAQRASFEASMKSSKQAVNPNGKIEKHLANIERRLASQPNIGIEIEKVYGNVYDMIKTEVRTAMKKTSKKRLGR